MCLIACDLPRNVGRGDQGPIWDGGHRKNKKVLWTQDKTLKHKECESKLCLEAHPPHEVMNSMILRKQTLLLVSADTQFVPDREYTR